MGGTDLELTSPLISPGLLDRCDLYSLLRLPYNVIGWTFRCIKAHLRCEDLLTLTTSQIALESGGGGILAWFCPWRQGSAGTCIQRSFSHCDFRIRYNITMGIRVGFSTCE